MPDSNSSLLKFPCLFPLKVMGRAAPDFEALIMELASRHVPGFSADALQSRPSTEGNYVSLTLTVEAQSQAQLDDLYRELSAHPRVLMVL